MSQPLLKILVITPTFFPTMGGAERGIYEIYRRLIGRYEIHILAPYPKRPFLTPWPPGIQPIPLTLHRFTDTWNLLNLRGQRLLLGLLPPFSLSMAHATRQLARHLQPDVVNVHYAIPSGYAVQVLKTLQLPVLLSLIGRDIPGHGSLPFWPHHVRRVMQQATQSVFISAYSQAALVPKNPDRAKIIPYGVHEFPPVAPQESFRLRQRLGIPQNAPVLFALQRLEVVKRVDILLKSLPIIQQTCPDVWLVIGGSGAEQRRLMETAVHLGIQQRVRFVGFIEETLLPVYFSMADIFLFHSMFETFGVAVAEAMAARKPIVAADHTAIPALIQHQQTGWLVPPLRPDLLAQGVLALLKNRELAQRFANQAYEYVRQTLNWEQIATAYEQTLLAICR